MNLYRAQRMRPLGHQAVGEYEAPPDDAQAKKDE